MRDINEGYKSQLEREMQDFLLTERWCIDEIEALNEKRREAYRGYYQKTLEIKALNDERIP